MRTHPRIAAVAPRGVALAILVGMLFVSGCQLAKPKFFTVGGTVAGLNGSNLVLQNNSGDNLTLSANGSFEAAFSVTVLTQPTKPAQNCIVSGSNGLATSTITQVVVTCTSTPLLVSDSTNNRVLIYNPPFTTGQTANFELGQAGFITKTEFTLWYCSGPNRQPLRD
jgi:hypothetical protein